MLPVIAVVEFVSFSTTGGWVDGAEGMKHMWRRGLSVQPVSLKEQESRYLV
jgi:hypothetical protein